MQRVNVIGAGKVGQTLMGLMGQADGVQVQDVLSGSLESARRAVQAAGAGQAAASIARMRPADIWLLTVPDDRIAAVAHDLAAAHTATAPGPAAVHCSGFLSSEVLAPLTDLGWRVASCHPVLSFADPQTARQQFPGTPCGIEGTAAADIRSLINALGGQPFAVATDRKALYHAAAVFSNNFTTVLQAIAREAWTEAGVTDAIAADLSAKLLSSTAENVARLGPAAALTGPAARGDTEVIRHQQQVVAEWHPEAAELYRLMTRLATRLKATGRVTGDRGGDGSRGALQDGPLPK